LVGHAAENFSVPFEQPVAGDGKAAADGGIAEINRRDHFERRGPDTVANRKRIRDGGGSERAAVEDDDAADELEADRDRAGIECERSLLEAVSAETPGDVERAAGDDDVVTRPQLEIAGVDFGGIIYLKPASVAADAGVVRVLVSLPDSGGVRPVENGSIAVSPDGRRIAFSLGAVGRQEIWAMENFPPAGR